MRSQREYLQQNLDEWHGLLTCFSPQGELLEQTPTISSKELKENQTIRQSIYHPSQSSYSKAEQDKSGCNSLGEDVLFFDNGAFSQGSVQVTPGSEFTAEFGLIDGDRCLRLVQEFNQTGCLDRLTLIRERRADAITVEYPHLTVDDLLGEWHGEAVKLYVDGHSPDTYPTKLRYDKNSSCQLTQQIAIQGPETHIVTLTAKIEGSNLYFDEGHQPSQVMLLPDGASATFPQRVKEVGRLFLEVGWLLQPNLRQRLIRSYNDQGEWISLTLVTERKTQL